MVVPEYTNVETVPEYKNSQEEDKEVRVDPRVFIASFPKSGTHLVELIVQTICSPMPANKPWAGTFMGHSWTTQWIDTKKTLRRIGFIRDGTYAKGHLGYKSEIENFLFGIGAAVLFVYRDPRDVAVSLAHHILDGKPHGSNEMYQEMGFDATLLAVIQGLGVYSGILERWAYYAPWLDTTWVLPVKFEDLITNKREKITEIVRYIVGHSANVRGYEATIHQSVLDETVEAMVQNSENTDKSPTFRKGKVGGWKEEFKAAHDIAFKTADEESQVLIQLGYETDDKWKSKAHEKLLEEIQEKEAQEAEQEENE